MKNIQLDKQEFINDFIKRFNGEYYHIIHPLGFDKITFNDIENNAQYRIHYFHNRKFLDNIHTHRFDFISLILSGSYKQTIYEKIKGKNYYNYITEKQTKISNYNIKYNGFCDVKKISETIYGKNDFNILKSNKFHKIEPMEETLTLFKIFNFKEKCEIISKNENELNEKVKIINDKSESEKILNKILKFKK